MELNVYVIDDDKKITDQLSEIIKAWAIKKNLNVNVVKKNDLYEVTPSMIAAFDLIILDIKIGDFDGISFAQELRKIGSDATIAFISSYEQYAINGYSVHAISYLLKPLKVAAIETILEEALSVIGDFSSKSIHITQNGKTRFISVSSILYAEAYSKRIIMHLKDKEESFYMTINELESQLTGTSLVRCHRSFIVNLEYIRVFTNNHLYLYDVATSIPVGRSFVVKFKEQLFRKRMIV